MGNIFTNIKNNIKNNIECELCINYITKKILSF